MGRVGRDGRAALSWHPSAKNGDGTIALARDGPLLGQADGADRARRSNS